MTGTGRHKESGFSRQQTVNYDNTQKNWRWGGGINYYMKVAPQAAWLCMHTLAILLFYHAQSTTSTHSTRVLQTKICAVIIMSTIRLFCSLLFSKRDGPTVFLFTLIFKLKKTDSLRSHTLGRLTRRVSNP